MRIRATCQRCGRDFLFFQLYAADPEVSDRCPGCSAHLGVMGVGRQAARADQALAALVQALEGMDEQHRVFLGSGGQAPRATVESRHRRGGRGGGSGGRRERGEVTSVSDLAAISLRYARGHAPHDRRHHNPCSTCAWSSGPWPANSPSSSTKRERRHDGSG